MTGPKANPIDNKVLWDFLSKGRSLEDIAEACNRKSISKISVKMHLLEYCMAEKKTLKNLETRMKRIGAPRARRAKKSDKSKIKKHYAKITAAGSISVPARIIKAKGISDSMDEQLSKCVRYDVRWTKKTGKIILTPSIDVDKMKKVLERDSESSGTGALEVQLYDKTYKI